MWVLTESELQFINRQNKLQTSKNVWALPFCLINIGIEQLHYRNDILYNIES